MFLVDGSKPQSRVIANSDCRVHNYIESLYLIVLSENPRVIRGVNGRLNVQEHPSNNYVYDGNYVECSTIAYLPIAIKTINKRTVYHTLACTRASPLRRDPITEG